MRILYSLSIGFYALAVRIAAFFYHKARLMVKGWSVWNNSKVPFDKLQGPVAWFHVSSLGEFEQARPIIEAFRNDHPDYKICLTFFSPSGYEVRKNYSGADLVFYLPPDTRRNAKRLIRQIHPDIAFFVKYDFWFNYIKELSNKGIPTYIFSTIFRPNQYFFRWYGCWFAKQLHCFNRIFVQNEESLKLLEKIGYNNAMIAGDTRYDRVIEIARSAKPIPAIELFLNQSHNQAITQSRIKTIVAGSSWEPDENNIKLFIDSYNKPLKLILAPHVISESHLIAIERLFGKSNCIRFSSIFNSQSEKPKNQTSEYPNILIIDNIGMLSSIYQYATVAYIGGGFGKGIHNILEATAYNIPVCFGPNYHKFKEAHDMIAAGGARSYNDACQLKDILSLWLDNDDAYSKASLSCKLVMSKEGGAKETIMNNLSVS